MTNVQLEKLKKENPLSPVLKDKYKVVGVIPGPIKFKGIQYDLRTMDLATAELLAADNEFRYLVKVKVK